MPEPVPVTMSATLAADEELTRRREAGEQVLALASGEIGLPVLDALRMRLAAAAHRNAYGPVAGSPALRTAAAGYWQRRALATDPALVVAGPGSKPLLFALMLAIGGDTVVPVPSWVSYATQARLAGARPLPVPTPPGQGGVPDPDALREAVTRARAAGRTVRGVIVTLPDNPTGTIAHPDTLRRLAEAARDLDLVIVSDEIYCDLVFDPADSAAAPAAGVPCGSTAVPPPALSPAHFAPERTVVTTGLTKNLAVGGWRTGIARLPEGDLGRALHTRLTAVASQLWSSTAAPVQDAAAWALTEPAEVRAYVTAARRLHERVVTAAADRLAAAGARLAPVRATCYLYPDFEDLRTHLRQAHHVDGSDDLAALFARRWGVGLLPATAFGEDTRPLRVRIATSRLYGDTEEQQNTALTAADPLALPWIKAALDRLEEVLDLLTTTTARPAATARPAVAARA
ncbi:pyridoxal phosphate-dependent aminotransferase [Kitasatospora sp. NPDC093806]|uniref:pyridoxal phosphate-dependent aminotransferase n=1 Tax=Kitasatospora sp. NPDC093806 TaxID=3155075 RepID=UPI003414E4F1